MTHRILEQLRQVPGTGAIGHDARGTPRVSPERAEALAAVCRLAHQERWKIRVEGTGSWLLPDAPADLAVATAGLNHLVAVSPADLVATVQAGMTLESLHRELAPRRLQLALDPPGRPDRTLGSVIATGTAGALRQGYGPVRDQVLGATVVTGDGRVVESGGRVVKNVAGFDLTKLHCGGFGAFGIVTELHLRLRATPAADRTLIAVGSRRALAELATALLELQAGVAALELLSPASAARADWTLAVRLTGSDQAVESETGRITATRTDWQTLAPAEAGHFWHLVARAPLGAPAAIRLGALLDGLDDATDLVVESLGEGLLAIGAGSGVLRWAGDPDPARLLALRRRCAEREVPLTLERGPWALRRVVGHFGAYREGAGALTARVRETFDPGGVFAVALDGTDAA